MNFFFLFIYAQFLNTFCLKKKKIFFSIKKTNMNTHACQEKYNKANNNKRISS